MHGEQTPDQAQVQPAFMGRPTHLHPMWRYGLAVAWAASLVGLLVPENQGYDLGKRPFWWDGAILVVGGGRRRRDPRPAGLAMGAARSRSG